MLLGCSAAFGYTNTYRTTSYHTNTNSYYTATAPSYQFHTTSVYTSVVENPTFSPIAADPYSNSSPHRSLRKAVLEDDDDDDGDPDSDPIGQIPDPTPIGEPLVLLLLAALYGGYRLMKRRKVIS